MPPRIWLLFGLVIVACGIPCAAQRVSSFGSRAGGFSRGPGFTHRGNPGFSQRGDVPRFSTVPPAFSRFPRSQPPMHGFRDWPGISQSFRNGGLARASGRERPLVPRPPLRPSLSMASRASVVPRPPLTSAMPIRAGVSPVPRPPRASVVSARAESSAMPGLQRTSGGPVQAGFSAAARSATSFGTSGVPFGTKSQVLFSSRQFFVNPFFPSAFLFPRPLFFSPFFVNPFFFPEPFLFSPFIFDAFFFPSPFFFSPFLPSPFFPQSFFFSFGSSPFLFGSPFRSSFVSSPFVPFTFRSGGIGHDVPLLGRGGLSSAGFTRRQP